MNEFDRIARFFRPLAGPEGLGLADDAALMHPPPGSDLVLTKDMMVEDRHWLAGTPPAPLARKLLAVNLSDLAACGAAPLGYLLALSLPGHADERWLDAFSAGLAEAQAAHGLSLWGGDMTGAAEAIVLCATLVGAVPKGQMLRRTGAKPGDTIYVSGVVGEGVLGLWAARGRVMGVGPAHAHYMVPRPRLALGIALRGIATACADVSDGLLADLGHLCRASGVGAVLQAQAIPLSPHARRHIAQKPAHFIDLVTGGDDYELVFTGAPGLPEMLGGVPIHAIGNIVSGAGVEILDAKGAPMPYRAAGHDHFRRHDR